MTPEDKLDHAIAKIYELRGICFDILKELKELNSHRTTTPRLGEQDPEKK
jgi:hypothetical protein